jgi:hypothetical protein
MPNINYLKENLNYLRDAGIIFARNVSLISRITEDFFSQIKNCQTIESANQYFDQLDAIQSTLAILVHEEDVEIPERLWRFMSDFDNFEEAKYRYFSMIKRGEYTF